MEPLTIALGLAKLTGLDEKIGRWLDGENGEKVAAKVIDVAQQMTGKKSAADAFKSVEQSGVVQLDLKMALLNSENDLIKLAYEDRANARAMQTVALQSDDKFSKRFVYYFAIAWSLFAFGYLACITFGTIPEGNQRFADVILGFLLGTVLSGMFAFFYGSSAGNERRAEIQELKSIADK